MTRGRCGGMTLWLNTGAVSPLCVSPASQLDSAPRVGQGGSIAECRAYRHRRSNTVLHAAVIPAWLTPVEADSTVSSDWLSNAWLEGGSMSVKIISDRSAEWVAAGLSARLDLNLLMTFLDIVN